MEQEAPKDKSKSELIDEVIKTKLGNITEAEKKQVKEIFTKVLEQDMKLKDAMGMDDRTVEGFYAYAYGQYENGKYKEALALFQFLRSLDESDPKFYLAIGACLHKLKRYKPATYAYMGAGMMNPKDPLPFYYMADCYLQLDRKQSAAVSLQITIDRAQLNPIYKAIQDKCELMLDAMKNDIVMPKKPEFLQDEKPASTQTKQAQPTQAKQAPQTQMKQAQPNQVKQTTQIQNKQAAPVQPKKKVA